MYVNIWQWFNDFHRSAVLAGDYERQQLTYLFDRAWECREDSPQQAVALLLQAREIAEKLREPWWILFHDYWRSEMLLFYVDDLKAALDLAVRNAVETHKPAYERCPIVGRVFRVLLDVYVFSDPVGYIDKINETIEYLIKEVPLDYNSRCLLKSRRITVAFAFERLDEAYDIALRYLNMCSTDFRLTHAHSVLCRLAYLRDDLPGALGHSKASESYAHREGLKSSVALAQAWQALFARKQGDEEMARRLYRLTTSTMAGLGVKPGNSYYDALCEYHEINSDSDEALRLREQQLIETIGGSGFYSETEVYLKMLRLLGRMGKPLEETLAAARKSGAQLINPTLFLAKLDKILQGDYSDPY